MNLTWKTDFPFFPKKHLSHLFPAGAVCKGNWTRIEKKNYYYSPLKEIPYGLIMYLKYFYSGWLLFLWLFVTSVVFFILAFSIANKIGAIGILCLEEKNKSGGKFRGPLFYMTGFYMHAIKWREETHSWRWQHKNKFRARVYSLFTCYYDYPSLQREILWIPFIHATHVIAFSSQEIKRKKLIFYIYLEFRYLLRFKKVIDFLVKIVIFLWYLLTF